MSSETAIRVISFDGKKANWTGWKEKFLAKAKKKGHKDILLGTRAVVKRDESISGPQNVLC